MDAQPTRRWSRRTFLLDTALAAGGFALAGAIRMLAPPGTARLGGARDGGLIAEATAPPSASPPTSPSPSPGPSPTVDPASLRHHFRSRPDLTPPLLRIAVPADPAVAPGYVFFTPDNGDAPDRPMIVDDSGQPVWIAPGGGDRTTDLKVATFRGAPVLQWWEGSINGGIGSGSAVIVDATYREIARFTMTGGYPIDLHEFVLTDRGTALLLGDAGVGADRAIEGSAGASGQVLDCGVWEIEIATGRVLFEWHSIDHIPLQETFVDPPEDGKAIWDYLHLNSIDVDTDGGLLLSARNTSAIYKIERPSGRVVWRLGGKRSDFTEGPGASFSWQHDARRQPDGTISLFDDDADPGTSRAIVLAVDEAAGRSRLVRAYTRDPKVLARSQGNTQLLPNGNVMVGWGDAPYWTEFAPDGRVLFDVGYPVAKMSYRVFRFPWTGRPSAPPDVAVAGASADAITVYVSWNGATDVVTWEVLAGATARQLRSVARAPRSGFETAIRVPAQAGVLVVRARAANGDVLGESGPITVAA